MLAPCGFTQQLNQDAYVQARMVAEKKRGILRFRIPMYVLAVALVLGGIKTAVESGGRGIFLLTALVLFCAAIVCVILTAVTVPRHIATVAAKDYTVYHALFDPCEVTFQSDDMTFRGEHFTRRVEYAKTRVCIETAQRYVLITDDEKLIVLEKACFHDSDNTNAFLRDVFARWYGRG